MTDTANDHMTAEEYCQHQADSMSEAEIHKAVINYADRLAGKYPALALLFHPPNGGKMPPGSAGKMKGMGMRRGVPDLLLPVPTWKNHESGERTRFAYSGLALELKSSDGYLRSEQAWWLRRLKEEGWAVSVARSVAGAIDVLEAYLDGGHEEEDLPLGRAEAPDHV